MSAKFFYLGLFISLRLKHGTTYTIIKTVTYEQDNKALINSTDSLPFSYLHFKNALKLMVLIDRLKA